MLNTLVRSLKSGVVTTCYPAERASVPERFRGAPEAREKSSFTDLPSPTVCPSGALETTGDAENDYRIDLARCIFCGRCAREPAESALRMGHEFELAAHRREDLLVSLRRGAQGEVVVAPGTEEPTRDELEQRVRASIHKTLSRSLALRHLDAGSCNACDWELVSLLAPHYDVRRLGIDFVASPRHADGVIVTGPVTRNLEAAVRRTWEAVPEPRIVIAVGACACSGGIVGTSYASAGGVEQLLPVDVFIPGCPPRPEAILYGILAAVGRIDVRRRRATR